MKKLSLKFLKKSDHQRLLERCDKIFKQILLKEREHKCEWCGVVTDNLQVAHILPKGKYTKMRYRRENVLLLHFPCHPEKWHKSPLDAAAFITQYKGPEYRQTLLEIDKWMDKHTTVYLMALIQKFNEELLGVKG